tara:strand:- start:14339 stop:15835 length:1497 start_codon:yes stop_codon:yes gene_type:complete
MADSNIIGGNSLYSGQGKHFDGSAASAQATNTGALRRKYNFGNYVSELNLAQDPFFRFVSMVSKKPTDDPNFKFTERRQSYMKRYAYMDSYSDVALAAPASNPDAATHTATAGSSVFTFKMYTDYNSDGNMQNIMGQPITYCAGVAGTQPQFYVPGQLIKFATGTTNGTPTDYSLWRINTVDLVSQPNYAILNATCVRGSGAAAEFMDAISIVGSSATAGTTVAQSAESLEPYRSYVVGSAHGVGTGYPETWADQPWSTSNGQTQIWKTSAVMHNTDRATVLKYEGNEWARIWKEKLIEHKWDIEQSLLFGKQATTGGINTTEGAVDFISTYGNSFSLDLATKTQDSFLDDMSALLDPRYNNASATVFFCSTAVYNWLHKLSGYFQNNLETSANLRADMGFAGKKKVFGVDISTISTVYGDMNVARNVHLDGTNIKILGINMKYCAYRPLVGNGINRDTGVYVGVQTLENSGVDRRVDQILTEAGMEWCCPETHALWV